MIIKTISDFAGNSLYEIYPEDTADFYFQLVLDISFFGKESALYDISICSGKWISRKVSEENNFFSRGLIIFNEYNVEKITLKINKIVKEIVADKQEPYLELAKYFDYEFDNYKP